MAIPPWATLAGLLTQLVILLAAFALWKWRGRKEDQQKKELAVAVKQRTQDLARMVERAQESSRLKSRFLANVSHELRTPLTGILGTLELASMTELTAEQKEYLELSKTSAQSLLELLDDLQDFSKMEADRIEINHVEFSLGHSVRGAIASMSPRAESKGLQLGVQVSPAVPDYIMGDPDRLRQVLLGVLDPVVKATSAGKVVIDIRPHKPRAQDKPHARSLNLLFSVYASDAGAPQFVNDGSPQAFRQPDGAARKQDGSALAMHERLVWLMGGRLWIDGEAGAGGRYCFTAQFELPDKSIARTSSGGAADTEEKDGMKGVCVLLAEDNRINQVVTMRMLEKHGCHVLVAKNGREVLEKLQWESVDLVLMDVQMPEMDGLEATRRIRELERKTGAHVPILAMTADALQGDRDKCLVAGMDGYLTKPVQSGQLYQAIADVLAN